MRTIKFRGKRVDDGGWVYGDFCNYKFDGMDETIPCIHIGNLGYIKNAFYQVDPNTVGQFSGLLDKNGKEIYEHDIVRYYDDIEDELATSHVIYHKESCSFCAAPTKLCGDYVGITAYWQFEVIGNIHDNPEMLKGGTEHGED